MTTSVFIYALGNKAVKIKKSHDNDEVVIQPGCSPIQLLIHGDQSLTASETGEFIDSSIDAKAKKAWEAYSLQGGGVTFDGKPLPMWADLGADRQDCWRAAVKAI